MTHSLCPKDFPESSQSSELEIRVCVSGLQWLRHINPRRPSLQAGLSFSQAQTWQGRPHLVLPLGDCWAGTCRKSGWGNPSSNEAVFLKTHFLKFWLKIEKATLYLPNSVLVKLTTPPYTQRSGGVAQGFFLEIWWHMLLQGLTGSQILPLWVCAGHHLIVDFLPCRQLQESFRNRLRFASWFARAVNLLFSPSSPASQDPSDKGTAASWIHNNPASSSLNNTSSGNWKRLITFGWSAGINPSYPWIGIDGPHALQPAVCLHPLPSLQWTFFWDNKKPTCHPGWETNGSCVPASNPWSDREGQTRRGSRQQAMLQAFLERPPEPQDTNALSGGLEPLCSFQLTGIDSPCVQSKASSDRPL